MKVLKFYADWCNPCKKLSGMLEDIDLPSEVIIENKNIDEAVEDAVNYNVRTVPTLIFLTNSGKELKRIIGLPSSMEALEEAFSMEDK